jgi:murein DD-endopeptidase MepM/ murein hydrolase activator NlpD
LSSVAVRRGERVATGSLLGRVGSTGLSTGPHLHFELRLRGAALDPLTGL